MCLCISLWRLLFCVIRDLDQTCSWPRICGSMNHECTVNLSASHPFSSKIIHQMCFTPKRGVWHMKASPRARKLAADGRVCFKALLMRLWSAALTRLPDEALMERELSQISMSEHYLDYKTQTPSTLVSAAVGVWWLCSCEANSEKQHRVFVFFGSVTNNQWALMSSVRFPLSALKSHSHGRSSSCWRCCSKSVRVDCKS